MAEETKDSKWEGKAIAELKTTKAEQVWPLFEDFCSIHKWLPTLTTSHYVEGTYGQPGLVRYCGTNVPNTTNQTPATIVKWCHEKLLFIDPIQKFLRYEIVENNYGFTDYVAELKVIEIESGCRIEWSYIADPVEGWRFEDLFGAIESSLKNMVERIDKELQTANI